MVATAQMNAMARLMAAITGNVGNAEENPGSQTAIFEEHLGEVLKTLSNREQLVLIERFGLVDGVPKTREEVGGKFQVTCESIRQIENTAIRKLRHPVRLKKLGLWNGG